MIDEYLSMNINHNNNTLIFPKHPSLGPTSIDSDSHPCNPATPLIRQSDRKTVRSGQQGGCAPEQGPGAPGLRPGAAGPGVWGPQSEHPAANGLAPATLAPWPSCCPCLAPYFHISLFCTLRFSSYCTFYIMRVRKRHGGSSIKLADTLKLSFSFSS